MAMAPGRSDTALPPRQHPRGGDEYRTQQQEERQEHHAVARHGWEAVRGDVGERIEVAPARSSKEQAEGEVRQGIAQPPNRIPKMQAALGGPEDPPQDIQ